MKTKQSRLDACKKHRHSKKGLIGTIYATQKSSSKKRNHPQPTYTLEELRTAVMAMPLYNTLHAAWVESNYDTKLTPSLDRIDDYKPYTKDNIQLMTWQENNAKSHLDMKEGRNNKRSKAVEQFTLDEEYITTYHSTWEANRQTNISQGNIGMCCRGERKSANGFKWQYAS